MKDQNWRIWLTNCFKFLSLILIFSSCSSEKLTIKNALLRLPIEEVLSLDSIQVDKLFLNGTIINDLTNSSGNQEIKIVQDEQSVRITKKFLDNSYNESIDDFKIFKHSDGSHIVLHCQSLFIDTQQEINSINAYQIDEDVKNFKCYNVQEAMIKAFFLSESVPERMYKTVLRLMNTASDFDTKSEKTVQFFSYFQQKGTLFEENSLTFTFLWTGKKFILQEEKDNKKVVPSP